MSSAVQRAAPDRCATRSALRGDPMIGTAFPAARILLVEQPGPWGRRGLLDSAFPAGAGQVLESRARAAGVRVQVVRRPGRPAAASPAPPQPRSWALVDTRTGHRSARWGTFDDPAELADLPLDGTAGTPDERPALLVCAHSRHDVCCALRGRPVAEALSTLLPGRVWETSHLGGDRFAANVLSLPSGLLYGRVLTFAAADVVASAASGEVLVPLLRGRIGLAPAAQTAVAHAHAVLGLPHVDDVTVLSTSRFDGDNATVTLRAGGTEVDVTVSARQVTASRLTCHATGTGAFWTYRATALVPRT